MSREIRGCLRKAGLQNDVRVVEIPPTNLKGQLNTFIKDRPLVIIDNCTIYCSDANERKVGGPAIAVGNYYNNLVEGFGSTSRCAFVRLRDRRGLKLWIVSAHTSTETAEDHKKDAFYDELSILISKIPSQQAVTVEIAMNEMQRWDLNNNPMCLENAPRKKFAFASAETKSTYSSVCVARASGDFSQEKRLKRRKRRQLRSRERMDVKSEGV
ncbi:hypothetical protein RB195_023993 [Necator americanus]|uniref:Uncharacterized protein n=1 Tax=Necator americanus TaxID=51031 RepID=A0ABR1ELJ9_NECAM